MALPVLIIGKSGAGKSTSMRKYEDFAQGLGIISVLGKPMPFKNDIKPYVTDDYNKIKGALSKFKAQSIVIDDAGYLITNAFMRGHAGSKKGNAVFELYNDMADNFWGLINFVTHHLDANKIVYIIMHEDESDSGAVKPKTIGKLLDDKVCVEGMFTIVLRASYQDGKHLFLTQTNGLDVAKSPLEMFSEITIDNDLAIVDNSIREYYNLYKLDDAKEEINNEKS